eukprot:gene12368-biopygen8815
MRPLFVWRQRWVLLVAGMSAEASMMFVVRAHSSLLILAQRRGGADVP